MKKIPLTEAVGETLWHDLTAIGQDSGKQVPFRRGHVLREEDIPALLSMGKTHIFVGEPAARQVHEDEAGLLGAKVLAGPGIGFSGPLEGKFTLFSETDGLFTVNREGLFAFNAVPDYTAATIPGDTPVRAGEPLAGVRIVPLFTQQENADRVLALGERYGPLLSLRPFLPLKTGFVITGTEVYTGRIEDRFEPVLREKTARFGGQVIGLRICPDDLTRIDSAVGELLQLGAELLLFTGGMSVDPDDLTPAAIRRTGATVVARGVPLQPGNMLMLAYLENCTLLGVPGAAMQRPVTALDVILPRIFVGERLSASDFAQLGEGGLCLSCEACGYPICYFGRNRYRL